MTGDFCPEYDADLGFYLLDLFDVLLAFDSFCSK